MDQSRPQLIFISPFSNLRLWLQILEEMEKEFGISCPSGLTKDQSQEEMLDQDKRDSALRGSFQSHQEELERAQSTISQMEEEKNKVYIYML